MGKVEFKSKVKKLPGTRPKTVFPERAEALGPGSEPQSSASVGRPQKPRDKPRSLSQSRRGSKGRPVTSIGQTAVRFPIVGIGASADRKSTRLNSSHITISYAVFCLKKKKKKTK